MLFVDEFCGILVYIKFGADVTSQYFLIKVIESLTPLPPSAQKVTLAAAMPL